MKNLELLQLINQTPSEPFENVQNFTQTPNEIYFIKNSLYKYNFNTNTIEEIYPQQFENVLTIQYLPIEQKICVITPETFHIIDPEGLFIVISRNFDEKIAQISWNPTCELVVTVTINGNVQTFLIDYESGDFFIQGQSNFCANIPDHVYVGWGSKETQFRGSEGKIKPNQAIVEAAPVFDEIPTISWRGNGEMFVINYWKSQKRQFIVFETPCKALYRSEECLGLQPPIAWRPTGNMIAGTTENNIVIFEKNGQKRFEIALESGFGSKILKLKWSPCANVLALYLSTKTIQLLTCSNYKWYLKQNLQFLEENPLLDFDWIETNDNTYILQVVTKYNVTKYLFVSRIIRSEQICSVINGNILQLTDFGAEIIPPILSTREISVQKPINFACIDSDSSEIAIIDSFNNFYHLDLNGNELTNFDLNKIAKISIPLALNHFVLHKRTLYFIVESEKSTQYVVFDVNLSKIKFLSDAKICSRHLVVGENFQNDDLFHIFDDLYAIKRLDSIQEVVKNINNDTFNCFLTSNGQFFINNIKIRDGVSSFVISRDAYLLFTTKSHELFCIRLNSRADIQKLTNENIYRRSVEQGANIVCAIPNSPKVVLQMPRGNLETISCRLISIDILDKLLTENNWRQAVHFIRIEKLNGNLLFDLNPTRFLENIPKFIKACETGNELSAICVEFEEANVLNTLYKNWNLTQENYPNKIEIVFKAILNYFDTVDYADYITTIMIINLNLFDLKSALVYLQDLLKRSQDGTNNSTLKNKVLTAMQTLKNYGCDQDRLFIESLLLYDLDLAQFVANSCQMDPRVFEPQLANLRNLTDEARRRYEINLVAKKPKIAISYLLRCKNVEENEIISFLQQYKVAKEAYATCKKSSKFFKIVSQTFAEDLSRNGKYSDAGIVLNRAKLYEVALDMFIKALEWRQVLILMENLKLDVVERIRIVNNLAGEIVIKGNVQEAAHLYEFYANNYEMAVKILVENLFFEEAVHLAKKHGRHDVIVSDIIPSATKHKSYLLQKLDELQTLFNKYKQRLIQVRKTKSDKFNNNFEFDENERDNDLFSDAGSVVSTKSSRSSRSRSSTASSRNRRKEARKKQDLREGGVYEDIALIRVLHSIINEIYLKRNEVICCCTVLMQESDLEYGEIKELYNKYKEIDENIKKSCGLIWPQHFYGNRDNLEREQLADLDNFEHLDLEYRTAPNRTTDFNLSIFD